ncbi:MAG: trypsin-like peptidase domain-containing protein [Thermoflexales bacterium]|nr:trypsin-like peptidase domain-containing protein [Thermoflexales bacterium]
MADRALADMIAAAKASVVQIYTAGRGIGAGVIWHSDAVHSEVITNAHVVAGLERRPSDWLRVVTADGRSFKAQVLASDPRLDLARLSVPVGRLPAAKVGDSTRLRVGELVFAIGNPWGQAGVVTSGIISGLGSMTLRGAGRTAPYIRSDVSLAPGNSGGPLLNASGEVVGINAMIFGGDLGMAIPSHVVAEWTAQETWA